MRKLATIRTIDSLDPIDGADRIEVATVGGWKVIAQKGLYKVGDMAVYFEIDSWIPHTLAPFLSNGKEPRVFEGVLGERLKTMRMRGVLSQGLLMPLTQIPKGSMGYEFGVTEGEDLTEYLGVLKWEKPIPAQLAGQIKGNFPTLIPKTDQERVQNLVKEIDGAAETGQLFEVTEKLEGSSMTVYQIDGEFGVCSRNLDLKRDENNSFWAAAIADDIEAKMKALDEHWNFAIQGELIGPGIQGNIYKLGKPEFYVFDVYNIEEGKYLTPADRRGFIDRMGLNHVPVRHLEYSIPPSVEGLLDAAEGKSVLNPHQEREGIVFKDVNGGFTFKAISNKYLLGEK